MKVPRPNLGVQVAVRDCEKYWGKIIITRVDHPGHRIAVNIEGHSAQIESTLNQLLGPGWNWMSIDDYNPLPSISNFLRAIAEWDYHYRASDDPRLYEEGEEYEQALISFFKQLSAPDQHQLQKIVEIVVMSSQPK